MEDHIIPFGKHKGKPVEILASDKQYMDWLLAQSWFKERHINLYNIVITNFREPDDTPEHNKIQIKFLKPEYRIKLAYIVNPNLFDQNSDKINKAMKVILNIPEGNQNEFFLKSLANPYKDDKFGLYSKQLLKLSQPGFERVDVYYSIWYGIRFYYNNGNYYGNYSEFRNENYSSYCVEVKPTVSDDFPAILRQMKASMPVKRSDYQSDYFYILVVGTYTGTSATREEFIEFFSTQGYKVVFEKEIENLILPEFERELQLDQEIEEKINHCG